MLQAPVFAAVCRRGRAGVACTAARRGPTITVLAALLTALLSAGPATGSNVPVADTAPCPLGYYRKAVLVFACGRQDGEVYFPLANVSKSAVGIPKGIRNLKLTMAASGPVDLVILDPANQTSVANGSAVDRTVSEWHGVRITRRSVQSEGGTKEAAAFSGTLPGKLVVKLANRLASQNLATITYSYDAFEGCPEVPVGCEKYNQQLTRQWVYNWSTWVSTEYPKASTAWLALASKAMHLQYRSGARAGPVPFHLWKGIWMKWPGVAHANRNLDWQAAFKFIDSLHTEDQLVEVVEFIRAYKLAGIGLSMYNWCTALRGQYPDAETAWAAVAGPTSIAGIDYSRWNSAVWPSFIPPDNFAKASSDGSFTFADENNNGVVSFKEFNAIYDSCSYRPSMYPASTADVAVTVTTSATPTSSSGASTTAKTELGAANGPRNTTTTASAATTTAIAACSAYSSCVALSLEGDCCPARKGERLDCCDAKKNQNLTLATPVATASAACLAHPGCAARDLKGDCCPGRDGKRLDCCSAKDDDLVAMKNASANISSPCCTEATAACSACRGRQSLQEAAGHSRHPENGEGNESTAATSTAVTDCPYDGVAYAPPLDGQNRSEEASLGDCQARCNATPGCGFFSFRRGSGACDLHGPSAVWSLAEELGAVAGPAVCVARVGIRVSDVDFKALTSSQKRSIEQRFVWDLANATELPTSAVKDLAGRPASVALSAGSLVAGARLELRPGGRLAEVGKRLSGEAMRQQLRESLAATDLRSSEVAAHPVHSRHAIDVFLQVSQECFLYGTRYDAPSGSAAAEGEAQTRRLLAHASSVEVGNASACQAACVEERRCEYFTFVPSTRACLLRGGSGIMALRDEDTVAGPRQCAGLPRVPFPSGTRAARDPKLLNQPGRYTMDAGIVQEEEDSGETSVWWWIFAAVLVSCFGGLLALALVPKRRGRGRKRGGKLGEAKYAPLSRQDPAEGEDGEEFSPTASESGSREVHAGLEDDAEEPRSGAPSREPRAVAVASVSSRELRTSVGRESPLQPSSFASGHGFLGPADLRRQAEGVQAPAERPAEQEPLVLSGGPSYY
uniref:Apple domain-containing protein n=1 Tax=Pyrodinium bahamense TaxID=73915 RepID=A0A7S0FS23_9DINO|mmetsp:Transcript_43920/g.122155  ORF Transcript_43920/g.122155 Transcript_43920/m.122155 type:complete len:1080 (+) Transcript_43920:67-3306(+)